MLRLLSKIFSENSIGYCMVGMLAIAALYLHTESQQVQTIGLIFGAIVVVLLIGILIKNFVAVLLYAYRWIRKYLKVQ